MSSIIICILLRFLVKNYKNINNVDKACFSMIIGGGISNLIDRIFRGYVVDYIDINQIITYPIFNVADVSVVVGVILIIGNILINTIKNRRRLKSGKI